MDTKLKIRTDSAVWNNGFQTIKTLILNEFLTPKTSLPMWATFLVASIAVTLVTDPGAVSYKAILPFTRK